MLRILGKYSGQKMPQPISDLGESCLFVCLPAQVKVNVMTNLTVQIQTDFLIDLVSDTLSLK